MHIHAHIYVYAGTGQLDARRCDEREKTVSIYLSIYLSIYHTYIQNIHIHTHRYTHRMSTRNGLDALTIAAAASRAPDRACTGCGRNTRTCMHACMHMQARWCCTLIYILSHTNTHVYMHCILSHTNNSLPQLWRRGLRPPTPAQSRSARCI